MKVTIGKDGLTKTWQKNFPATTKCCHGKCGGEARIGFVAHEGLDKDDLKSERVYRLHPNDGKSGFWIHDCCAVAVYFCRKCLSTTSLYNQG